MDDDLLYDEVAREIQARTMLPGIWTKSFAEAGGDIDRARAIYIKYRVAQLAGVRDKQLSEQRKEQLRNVLGAAKQQTVGGMRWFIYAAFAVGLGVLTFIFGAGTVIGLVAIFGGDREEAYSTGGLVLIFVCTCVFGFFTHRAVKAANNVRGKK